MVSLSHSGTSYNEKTREFNFGFIRKTKTIIPGQNGEVDVKYQAIVRIDSIESFDEMEVLYLAVSAYNWQQVPVPAKDAKDYASKNLLWVIKNEARTAFLKQYTKAA